MVLDDTTSRDGNCGISAFCKSIMSSMDAMQSHSTKKRTVTQSEKEFGRLRRSPHGQRVALARSAGVVWLHANANAKLWEGMTVAQLVRYVSGESISEYQVRMRGDGEWVDTVFLHALACVYGVTVLVFQDGCDPAILGPHLHTDLDQECDVMVPVALVNDYHFWAVVESRLPGLGWTPWARDKGEHLPFQSEDNRDGEYSSADMEEDNQAHHSSWMSPPGSRSSAEIEQ